MVRRIYSSLRIGLTPIRSPHLPHPYDQARPRPRRAQASRSFHPSPSPINRMCPRLTSFITHNSRERIQLCVFIAMASTHFLALYKHWEATNETTANLAPLVLSYSSLLFSLSGALSTALRAIPVIGIAFQDQPFTFVKRPTSPSTKVIFRAQMDLDDPHTVRRPHIPLWLQLSMGLWDCCTWWPRICFGPVSYPIPFPADSVIICLRKRGMPRSPGLAVYMLVRAVVCPSRWRH
jgi:hypothetical protein